VKSTLNEIAEIHSNKVRHSRPQNTNTMAEIDEDMEESDWEFELITVDPNICYESESDEELSQNDNQLQLKLSVSEEKPEERNEIKSEAEISSNKLETSCDTSIVTPMDEDSMSSSDMRKVRRKLNLQEYKMRRANETPPQKPLFDVPRKIAAFELCEVPASLPLLFLPTDPNWAMEMESEKKEDEKYSWHATKVNFNPDLYEEIIKVSIGCNTEVTIPPIQENEESCGVKPESKFLKNIVNNLNKDDAGSLLKSTTSLFSSIQEVVQKKCVATATEANIEQSHEMMSEEFKEHGEDKVIMHLRKDRFRPLKCNAALQTDSIALFPPLLLSPALIFNRIRNTGNYRRKISRSRSRSRSFSPSDKEYKRERYNSKRYSRSQHSTHSSSMDSSNSESSSDSDSHSSASNSSRSSNSLKRFNKRQNFKFYNRNQGNHQGYNYQEERKIVYIGGLEEETTKDEIRRKFLKYGTIKKISFHSKEDGLRYGFITFAEASCAYEVIDKFSKDSSLSLYDIRFGGRRNFCRQTYADLDSIQDVEYAEPQKQAIDLSFEELLKLAKKQLSSKK